MDANRTTNETISAQEAALGSILVVVGVVLLTFIILRHNMCQIVMRACIACCCLMISIVIAVIVVGICLLTGKIEIPDYIKESANEYARERLG